MVTQLDRPPELILEAWAIETRQRARADANFAKVLDKFEGRFGDIKEALKNLDFVSADSVRSCSSVYCCSDSIFIR